MRKLSLLLIEPDDTTSAAMSRVLGDYFGPGTVTAAESFADAACHSLADHDLILTEWDTGDIAGPNLLEGLRRQGARGIIVVTDANCGTAAAQAVTLGASDYIVRVGDYLLTLPLTVEKNLAFLRLKRERDVLHRQLVDQNETLAQLLISLEEAAATDPLTGLYNRGHLARVLEQMFDDASRGDHELACLMLDMDKFKVLNDTHGHQAGDMALTTLSTVIRSCLRKMDAAARYGGDEFVLLLPGTDPIEASRVAHRIRAAYAAAVAAAAGGIPGADTAPRAEIPRGISVGIASLRTDRPATPAALIAAADAALYRAKRLGRDRIQLSSPAPASRAG